MATKETDQLNGIAAQGDALFKTYSPRADDPEMQKSIEREASDAEDREVLSEIRAALSEIAAQISALQAKLGITESADIADAIANLRSIAAQLESGMIPVAGISAIVSRVQEAIADAHDVAEAAGIEWKAEVTEDYFSAAYEEKRLELARDLMARTEYYREMDEVFAQLSSGYNALSQEQRIDVNMVVRQMATSDPDGFGRAVTDVRIAQQQGKLDDVIAIQEEDEAKIDAVHAQLGAQQSAWLDRLKDASRIGHQGYSVTVDLAELTERIKKGDQAIDDAFIDAEVERIKVEKNKLIEDYVAIMAAQDPVAYRALQAEAAAGNYVSVEAYLSAEAIDPSKAAAGASDAMQKASVGLEVAQNLIEMSGYIRKYQKELEIDLSKEPSPEKGLTAFDEFVAMDARDAVDVMVQKGVVPEEDRAMMIASFTSMEVMAQNVQMGKDPAQAERVLMSYAAEMARKEGETAKAYQDRLRGVEAKIEREAGLKEGTLYAARSPEFQNALLGYTTGNADKTKVQQAFEISQTQYNRMERAERIAASYMLAAELAETDFIGSVDKHQLFWSVQGDRIYTEMVINGLSEEEALEITTRHLKNDSYTPSNEALNTVTGIKINAQASATEELEMEMLDDGTGAMVMSGQAGGLALLERQRLAYEAIQAHPERFRGEPGKKTRELFELARDFAVMQQTTSDDLTFEQRREMATRNLASVIGVKPENYLMSDEQKEQLLAEQRDTLIGNARKALDSASLEAVRRYEQDPLGATAADRSAALDYYKASAIVELSSSDVVLDASDLSQRADALGLQRHQELVNQQRIQEQQLAFEQYRADPLSASDEIRKKAEDYLFATKEDELVAGGEAISVALTKADEFAVKQMAAIEQQARIAEEDVARACPVVTINGAQVAATGDTIQPPKAANDDLERSIELLESRNDFALAAALRSAQAAGVTNVAGVTTNDVAAGAAAPAAAGDVKQVAADAGKAAADAGTGECEEVEKPEAAIAPDSTPAKDPQLIKSGGTAI